jgi:hypothetical protein
MSHCDDELDQNEPHESHDATLDSEIGFDGETDDDQLPLDEVERSRSVRIWMTRSKWPTSSRLAAKVTCWMMQRVNTRLRYPSDSPNRRSIALGS